MLQLTRFDGGVGGTSILKFQCLVVPAGAGPSWTVKITSFVFFVTDDGDVALYVTTFKDIFQIIHDRCDLVTH